MTASSRAEPPDPRVAVVVLNWNGWRDTIACLATLEGRDDAAENAIVVDNGSDDDSVERIRRRFPNVAVVETGRNLGFAGGCNVGIRHTLDAGATAVWLLNNDTRVAPGALAAMTDVLRRRPEVGIVGAVIKRLDRRDTVEAWGGGTANPRLATTRRNHRPERGHLDYVAGTSMLIRREVFEGVGLLDEKFFFYLEDVDFCRRAVANGWKLAVSPEAVVFHKGGATVNEGREARSERADRFHVRSSGVFLGKHAGRWIVAAVPMRLAAIMARRVLRGQIRRVPMLSREFVRGVSAGARRRA